MPCFVDDAPFPLDNMLIDGVASTSGEAYLQRQLHGGTDFIKTACMLGIRRPSPAWYSLTNFPAGERHVLYIQIFFFLGRCLRSVQGLLLVSGQRGHLMFASVRRVNGGTTCSAAGAACTRNSYVSLCAQYVNTEALGLFRLIGIRADRTRVGCADDVKARRNLGLRVY